MPRTVSPPIPARPRKRYRAHMSFARPIRIPSNPISLSDSQKNALAAAMGEVRQETRQSEPLRFTLSEPAAENRPIASEELLFIL